MGDWRTAANERIERLRKRDLIYRPPDARAGDRARFRLVRHDFPFGAAMSKECWRNPEFQRFFLDRFNWTTFGNESKWYANEVVEGVEDYAEADAMLDWCEAHDIPVRGHCVFWEPEQWQPEWVRGLSGPALRDAVTRRLEHCVEHFRARFRHWDVDNELLHGQFFRERLGENIWPWMFRETRRLDPDARLFVNDFNILSVDQNFEAVEVEAYVELIDSLQRAGAPIDAIGVQGHIWSEDLLANPAVLGDRFDRLAHLGLPIWITEFDVAGEDEARRADVVELVYRTAFAHPAVEGIVTWVVWAGDSWRGETAGLANLDWSLNAAGRRLDELFAEWTTDIDVEADADGAFRFRGFPGVYEASNLSEGRPNRRAQLLGNP